MGQPVLLPRPLYAYKHFRDEFSRRTTGGSGWIYWCCARTCLTDVYRNDTGNVVRMTYHGIHTIEQLRDNNTFPAALQWQIGNHQPIEVSTVRLVDLSSTAIEQLVATKETLDIFD